MADWITARGGNTEHTLTAAAGPSPCDPYRHSLAMRPPRKVRPFYFLNYYTKQAKPRDGHFRSSPCVPMLAVLVTRGAHCPLMFCARGARYPHFTRTLGFFYPQFARTSAPYSVPMPVDRLLALLPSPPPRGMQPLPASLTPPPVPPP